MAKAYETWTVTSHGPIEKISERHWRVAARFPGAPFDRAMQLVRLADGRVVVHNAIALGDAEMAEVEAWGRPSFLIVPSAGHRLDARIYKQRYAGIRVLAPPAARAKVGEVVQVDGTTGEDFGDATVRYDVLAGTGDGEGVLALTTDTGTTVVVNDVLMNQQRLPGVGGFIMGLIGFTSAEPTVTFPGRMAVVKDRRALRGALEQWAGTPNLARLEVAHGAPVTTDVAGALARAAARL
jgi:hypothetical protein